MSQIKCEYFDKGYCKQKTQCTKRHPLVDCDSKCANENTCPLRHRIVCKNGGQCKFLETHCCSFLHPQPMHFEENVIQDITDKIKAVNGNIENCENKIKLLEKHADTGFPPSDIKTRRGRPR